MAWTRFGKKKDMPGGLWIKCESCGAMLFRKEYEQFGCRLPLDTRGTRGLNEQFGVRERCD